MGKNVVVNTPFWYDYGYNTTVGDYFFANHNFQILDNGKVTFGNTVFIAPNCLFTTAEHAIAAGVPCRVLRKITEADKYKYPHYTGN